MSISTRTLARIGTLLAGGVSSAGVQVVPYSSELSTASGWRVVHARVAPMSREIRLYVDGDACPVKDEVYVVATRYGLWVSVVANARMYVPRDIGVEMVVVEAGPDAADDWIAERVSPGDVVVTADIPLAARCLDAGGRVLGTNGRPFTEDSIGGALATRSLKEQLRETGIPTGGPRALSERDRSRFLAKLDELVQRSLRDR